MVRQFRETLPMGNTALAMPLVALPKHPTWLLSRWGISTHQLSALLLAAAKLEQQVTGPRSLAEPPEPWTGSAEQKQALHQLQQLVSDSWQDLASHHDLLWFLRQSGFDVAAAEQKLSAMLCWRKAHGLHGLTYQHISTELGTGKVYAHHHPDVKGRPVFVVRACRHMQGEFAADDTRRLFSVVVDEAIKLLQPGQDQFLGIVDLKGFSMANIDLGFATFVIDAFLAMYPGRLAQMVLVDAPWLFKGPWELIKSLLGKHADLVHFASRQQLARHFFTAETLPDDFRQ